MAGAAFAALTKPIEVSRDVQNIRRLLLDVADFGEQEGVWKGLELRFAGGWVRDILLGIKSNDIDVALSSTTGEEFGMVLERFLKESNNLNKYGFTKEDLGRSYKIEANPEKSKQLATASTKLQGIDLDFVNLRKEVYDPHSRTPTMDFGTAEEDARRRDATINALFYNLQTEQIEDFTGGLADMGSRLIRTPLEPEQTFMDDPLRILRLIRFASRLDFAIHEQARACMSNRQVLEAFMSKISRERVEIELGKMFKAHNPRSALILFDELGLYSTIFTSPSERLPISTDNWSNAYNCMQVIIDTHAPKCIREILFPTSEIPLCWLLASLVPLSQESLPSQPPHTKLPLPYAAVVAKNGLKQPNKVCELVAGASRHLHEIKAVKANFVSGISYTGARDVVGMKIRRWEEKGGQWKLQLLFAILVEAFEATSADGIIKVLTEWQEFLDHLEQLDLMDAASVKRLVDGKQLRDKLGVKSGGPWTKEALDVCMAWQFRNPGVTDISEAIQEVRNKATELGIPIV